MQEENIVMNRDDGTIVSFTAAAKPNINVTPLIDVLLVMLIIFMVAAPLRPSRFLTKVPSPPDNRDLEPPPLGLVVTIKSDRSLMLNGMADMGSVYDMSKLSTK